MNFKFLSVLSLFLVGGVCGTMAEQTAPLKKEKLQIIFCFGQSNMQGHAKVSTAWYLTQKNYLPKKEIILKPSRFLDWRNFYWTGLNYYQGPQKEALNALIAERKASRWKWRHRFFAKDLTKWQPAWGENPMTSSKSNQRFLDEKAEEEGIYQRMREILDSSENEFSPEDAYQELIQREKVTAEAVARIKKTFLYKTNAEDFAKFDKAVKEAKLQKMAKDTSVEVARTRYAELGNQHLNLPVAERTHILGHGGIAGSKKSSTGNTTHGALSIGYGAGMQDIGPEYSLGITLERLIDAPILIVKCSWGGTSVARKWRTPSLDGVETPIEKSERETKNKELEATAKKEGRTFEPILPPKKHGELSYAWKAIHQQIENILANPGKFHPEYDPKVGYEFAGLVWFQGFNDRGNRAYGELLGKLIKDFRKKLNTPKLPVICGTLGMPGFQNTAFSEQVNRSLVEISQEPEFKGSLDVVNSSPFFPIELGLTAQIKRSEKQGSLEREAAEKINRLAVSNRGFHYFGSAKFFLLLGDAMAHSLANLMRGGEPAVNKDWIK